MRAYSIAAIPADGIGPEVVAAGLEALRAIERRQGDLRFDVDTFAWGSGSWRAHCEMMPAGRGRDGRDPAGDGRGGRRDRRLETLTPRLSGRGAAGRRAGR